MYFFSAITTPKFFSRFLKSPQALLVFLILLITSPLLHAEGALEADVAKSDYSNISSYDPAGKKPSVLTGDGSLSEMLSASDDVVQTFDPSSDLLPVEDPNNPADATGFGAVKESYQIGKYDVTAEQYCAFLNAVAATSDEHGLYHEEMGEDPAVKCIARVSSSDGLNFSYQVIGGHGKFPVTYVRWSDALRFCNWLHHGQPRGKEVTPETTETGAYTFIEHEVEEVALLNPGAKYFLPTQHQWYKAAYYRPQLKNYWDYPTMALSPLAPGNSIGNCANEANYCVTRLWGDKHCTGKAPYLTDVGSFTGSAGPYGTFDMGGNVAQWTFDFDANANAIVRGGSWKSEFSYYKTNDLQSTSPGRSLDPTLGYNDVGFRVAAPARPLLPVSVKKPEHSHLVENAVQGTVEGAEFIVANVLPEIGEVLAYNAIGIYFILPYVGWMGGWIVYELAEKAYTLAAGLMVHMAFDVGVMLSSHFFQFDLAAALGDLLAQCGLGLVRDFFVAGHGLIDDLIHALGIPHSHGEQMAAEEVLTEELTPVLERTFGNGEVAAVAEGTAVVPSTQSTAIVPSTPVTAPKTSGDCCNQGGFNILGRPHRHRTVLPT